MSEPLAMSAWRDVSRLPAFNVSTRAGFVAVQSFGFTRRYTFADGSTLTFGPRRVIVRNGDGIACASGENRWTGRMRRRAL